MHSKDLSGKRFGRLLVIHQVPVPIKGSSFRCHCDCGNKYVVVRAKSLTYKGNTKSCGCWARERPKIVFTKHGMVNSREYATWEAMWRRCTKPNFKHYYLYGGRGITVCERWKDFRLFLEDMGRKPPKMALDRIDVNGNYEPSNCRWATHKEQQANKRPQVKHRALGILPPGSLEWL